MSICANRAFEVPCDMITSQFDLKSGRMRSFVEILASSKKKKEKKKRTPPIGRLSCQWPLEAHNSTCLRLLSQYRLVPSSIGADPAPSLYIKLEGSMRLRFTSNDCTLRQWTARVNECMLLDIFVVYRHVTGSVKAKRVVSYIWSMTACQP